MFFLDNEKLFLFRNDGNCLYFLDVFGVFGGDIMSKFCINIKFLYRINIKFMYGINNKFMYGIKINK